MYVKSFYHKAIADLLLLYSENEAKEMAFLLINHLTGFSKTAILLDNSVADFDENLFELLLKRLLKHEPIQYVVGKAYFLGNDFVVNRNTLIPRPETEELVALIIAENKEKSGLRIVDLGTGTGCIPISLKLQLPRNEYLAIDISPAALQVANENALAHKVEIQFVEADMLKLQHQVFAPAKFDIIVSNPPYVLESEKLDMKPNVLNFEPGLALFVPSTDPLIFYSAILNFAQLNLKPRGKVYFEINEKKSTTVMSEMKKFQFDMISVQTDFNKKARFAIGTFNPK